MRPTFRSRSRWPAPRRTALQAAALLTLAACGGDEKATPTDTAETTDTAGDVSIPSVLAELGLGSRVASLADASTAEHCARLEQAATTLGALLTDRAVLPEADATALRDAMSNFANDFGLYESLLFGEVHRLAEQALADDAVSATELQSVVRALTSYGRLAGVPSEARTALSAALGSVPAPATPGPVAEQLAAARRKHRATMTVRVANLVTDLQRCAPIAAE
jgi:hypothetical protein